MLKNYCKSSIGKKQIVAVSGLLLVGFIVFHLSANMLIFAGPEAYNYFPELMHSTGLGLRVMEAGLAAIFFTHIFFTFKLVRENRAARKQRYAVVTPKQKRSLATRLMPYTGTILLVFLILHIQDYVLADQMGQSAYVNGKHLGLYGIVANSFLNPLRSIFYIIAMFAIGFHLAHGIQSVCQTLGLYDESLTPKIQKISTAIGIMVAILFSSVPIYFMFFYQ